VAHSPNHALRPPVVERGTHGDLFVAHGRRLGVRARGYTARMDGLHVAVTGATGNIGTSLVRKLSSDARVASVLGIAGRLPKWRVPKTEFVSADLAEDELEPLLEGRGAVVHLAWLMQPTRDPATTWRTNVLGSKRLFDAVAFEERLELVLGEVGRDELGLGHAPFRQAPCDAQYRGDAGVATELPDQAGADVAGRAGDGHVQSIHACRVPAGAHA
jgi:hypothetical protein